MLWLRIASIICLCSITVCSALEHSEADFDFLLRDGFGDPELRGPFHSLMAGDPTAEPSAEPTPAPTASPSRPTLMPAYPAEYVLFDVSLKLNNATSDTLDGTATNILEESVAEAANVTTSSVTLDVYTAFPVNDPGNDCRRGPHVQEHQEAVQSSTVNSFWSVFHKGLLRSRHVNSPQPSILDRAGSQDSLACRRLAEQNYDIIANLSIKAILTDYPQFGSNATALWVALADSLSSSVDDGSLASLIVQKSITASSTTFAFISDILVVYISTPTEQFYPSSAPTQAPANDDGDGDSNSADRDPAPLNPGEVAGAIIAAMVGLGLAVLAVYFLCAWRARKQRADAYVVYDAFDTPTSTHPHSAPPGRAPGTGAAWRPLSSTVATTGDESERNDSVVL